MQKYKTHAYRTPKTAGVQTIVLKQPSGQLKNYRRKKRKKYPFFHNPLQPVLVGLVVKASAWRERKIPGSNPACAGFCFCFFFGGGGGRVESYKLALQWLPCQALGLVGPVSVHCDWVR